MGPNYWNWFGVKLVENSNLEINQKVLDVGCGRGASLFPASERVGKHGLTLGIDTSIEMIKHTQLDIEKEKYSNISLSCSDLINFHSPVSKLDYILCGFGLGYFEADKENYRRVHQLLKSNGEFGLSSWTHQEDQDWLTGLVNKYLEVEVSKENGNRHRDSNDMCTEVGVCSILNTENFVDVRTMTVENTFVFKTKEEWWNDLNFTAVKNILVAISEKGNLEQFKKEAFDGLDQFIERGEIHIKRKAILAYCRT